MLLTALKTFIIDCATQFSDESPNNWLIISENSAINGMAFPFYDVSLEATFLQDRSHK